MFSSGISFLENGRCNGVMVKLLKSIKKRIEGLYIYFRCYIHISIYLAFKQFKVCSKRITIRD